jgi:molecular chaperone GrpE
MSETEKQLENLEPQGDTAATTPSDSPPSIGEPEPITEAEPTVAATPTLDPDVAASANQPEADPAGDALAKLQAEIQALTSQLEEVTHQRDDFKGQYVRIAADFDNFRKRNSKEKEDIEIRTKCSTITELLGVVDNFERARTQIKPLNDGELNIHKSYQGVYKQLVESLKRIGVSPMRPEGQPFDPNLHEAVMRQPTEDHPEGTVIEELQRGYFLGDRILRHSLVKVAAPVEELSAQDALDPEMAEN